MILCKIGLDTFHGFVLSNDKEFSCRSFSSSHQYFGQWIALILELMWLALHRSENSCVHASICVHISMQSTCSSVSDFSQLFNLTPPIMLYHTHSILTFLPSRMRIQKATRNSFNGSKPLMCISWPAEYILCEFGNFRVTVLNDLWRVTTRNIVEVLQWQLWSSCERVFWIFSGLLWKTKLLNTNTNTKYQGEVVA